jgi:hypothetical protein
VSWVGIVGALAIAGSLYWFGLVGYRLFLSLKGLQAAGVPLQANLEQLADPIERDFTAAKNHTTEDLGEVLAKRKQLVKAKRDSAEQRRHRLIARLNDMNLDKR